MSLIKKEVIEILEKKNYGLSKEYAIENILTKTQSKKLGDKCTKSEVLEMARERASKSETICKKIAKDNPRLFSLHPSKVEELLGITTTERKRWQEEKKLKIDYYDSFSKYGSTFQIPMFNFIAISDITPSKIDEWRTKHKETIAKNRKKGAKVAAKTRVKNKSLVEEYKSNYAKTHNGWLKQSEKLAITMNLANWTMWVSRLAKTFQVKAHSSTKKSDEYNRKKEDCYELKEEAINLLKNAIEYSSLSVYIPSKTDKVHVEQLCESHYQHWCDVREWDYYPFGDYVHDNIDSITKCKQCNKSIQKNYYVLYYLKVEDMKTNTNFSFHIPYPIGKEYLPTIDSLPKVEHEEQEGVFRFGRTLLDEENIVYTEKRILSEFEKAICAFKMQYCLD